jgi:hypothetical protein
MLDTGIDAPDVEVLLMARPTKSKVLYVQMKGRGTRKCKETGKDFYKLVDFVDISRLEPVITNDTAGIEDEPIEQEQEEIIESERGGEVVGTNEAYRGTVVLSSRWLSLMFRFIWFSQKPSHPQYLRNYVGRWRLSSKGGWNVRASSSGLPRASSAGAISRARRYRTTRS